MGIVTVRRCECQPQGIQRPILTGDGAQGRKVRPPSIDITLGVTIENLSPGQGAFRRIALLPAGANAPQMFKLVARSYTLFGCVDSTYTRISGAGKQHGADLAINAPCFRGLNCRAWAALADHRKNQSPDRQMVARRIAVSSASGVGRNPRRLRALAILPEGGRLPAAEILRARILARMACGSRMPQDAPGAVGMHGSSRGCLTLPRATERCAPPRR